MRIGVDIGGTKIEAAILTDAGQIDLRRRIATPRTYEEAVDAIGRLIEGIQAERGAALSVGLGIPGTISPVTGTVKNAYNSPFNGHPLDPDLEARPGPRVRLMNDDNGFDLSEATTGSTAGTTA